MTDLGLGMKVNEIFGILGKFFFYLETVVEKNFKIFLTFYYSCHKKWWVIKGVSSML